MQFLRTREASGIQINEQASPLSCGCQWGCKQTVGTTMACGQIFCTAQTCSGLICIPSRQLALPHKRFRNGSWRGRKEYALTSPKTGKTYRIQVSAIGKALEDD